MFTFGEEVLCTCNDDLVTIESVDWNTNFLKFQYAVLDRDGDSFWVDEFELEKASNRVQFSGGGMRDSQEGKPRFELLVPEKVPYEHQYLTRVARLMAKGADHYSDRNWEQFSDEESLNRAKSAACRHFMQWLTGEEDEDHAAAVFFNVQAAEYIKGRINGEW